MPQIAKDIRVTGRVQGVAYRHWTSARARALHLTGWVKNDISGAVTAHLEGEKSDIDQMITDMWSGPAAASVRDVQSTNTALTGHCKSFEILH
ncbi:MAG: acylphosphatase [Cognatishimia sp.]